jgi:hypothetical protein
MKWGQLLTMTQICAQRFKHIELCIPKDNQKQNKNNLLTKKYLRHNTHTRLVVLIHKKILKIEEEARFGGKHL